jgi:hypothetical protein
LLSWWFLLPCLLVCGLAAYLLVEGTKAGDYPWAHYPLTVALAPILLVGVYAGAIVLSGAVFDFLETPQPASHSPSTVPATNENTRPESTHEVTQPPETTLQKTTPEDVAGSSSPSASSSASPTAASPTAPSTASPSAAPSASPAASASATASATVSASSASPSP